MTLTEINNQFKSVTDAITGLNGYSFGWPSDRIRSQTYDQPGEDQTDLYPRVLFAVPTMEQDVTLRNDVYQCQVFFDDLLGYDDTGETDLSTQAEKWLIRVPKITPLCMRALPRITISSAVTLVILQFSWRSSAAPLPPIITTFCRDWPTIWNSRPTLPGQRSNVRPAKSMAQFENRRSERAWSGWVE